MPFLEIRRADGCETWTVKRPERLNSLGTTLAQELAAALAAVAGRAPGETRALVIRAEPVVKGSRRTWISGGDLKELAALKGPDDARRYAGAMSAVIDGFDVLPMPVLVALDGTAIGGGAELALAGDIRLATAGSALEFRQLKAGLATGYGTAQRLVQLVGLAQAQRLAYGCLTVGADEALKLGLVHELVEDEARLGPAIERWVSDLDALGLEPVTAQKRMFRHATRSHPGAARGAELAEFGGVWGNPAHRKFLDAFLRGGS